MKIPPSMHALLLHGPGVDSLRFDDLPIQSPGPRQLLARVDAVIACASDSKIIDQGSDHTLMYGWDLSRHPVPIGHEGCLTIAAVGEDLYNDYRVGDRFALQPAVPTGPRHHRERYRDNAAGIEKIAIGYTLDGLFAEYVLLTEEVIDTGCILPLPDPKMPHFAAALAEPLSCIVAAQEHSIHIIKDGPHSPRTAQLGLKSGGITAILGAGPMGRMHAELALRYRPSILLVSDPLPARRQRLSDTLSQKVACLHVDLILTDPGRFEKDLHDASHGHGADDIIVALGIRPVQERAFALLARYGVANLFGGLKLGDHMLSLDGRRIHYDSVLAVGSSGGDPSDVAAALILLSDHTIDPGNYIAAVGGLDAAKDLLQAVREQRLDGKGVIYPHCRASLQEVDSWDESRERAFLKQHSIQTNQ